MRRISRNELFLTIIKSLSGKFSGYYKSNVSKDHNFSANQMYIKLSDSNIKEVRMEIYTFYFER